MILFAVLSIETLYLCFIHVTTLVLYLPNKQLPISYRIKPIFLKKTGDFVKKSLSSFSSSESVFLSKYDLFNNDRNVDNTNYPLLKAIVSNNNASELVIEILLLLIEYSLEHNIDLKIEEYEDFLEILLWRKNDFLTLLFNLETSPHTTKT
ncbi:hypothetical protein H8356DRAFT_1344011 [Neocallimastix lanati (nom. inval.)]|nr:hypothetical protein H8356DRAFT_1344011 [Neocallimastix sp. JGI-2020a]